MLKRVLGGWLLFAIAITTAAADAQGPAKIGADIRLPAAPEQWLNFPPLSLDRLGGKGVVLYFFDEECSNCAKRWPELMRQAELHSQDPVVIIAVNSGNSPRDVAAYVREHQITWPVIVDSDRSFERVALGLMINVQTKPSGIRIRKADGNWEANIRSRVPDAINAAAKGGKWRVNPAMVPVELRAAWGLVELGNFAAALPMIARTERRGDDAVKNAAAALRDAVAVSLGEEQEAIDKLLAEDRQWQAFVAIGSLLETYKGYEVDPTLEVKYKELKKSDAIEQEQAAAKKLQQAIRTGSVGSPAAVKRATTMLEKIKEQYPDTEAATKAEKLIEQVTAPAMLAPPEG